MHSICFKSIYIYYKKKQEIVLVLLQVLVIHQQDVEL